jgi:hypothetical protein
VKTLNRVADHQILAGLDWPVLLHSPDPLARKLVFLGTLKFGVAGLPFQAVTKTM